MTESPESRPLLIRARGLERVYRSGEEEVYAIRDIDLDIHQGEYISLMGPSGSGKSTFFNMIGALDTPTGGSIAIGGRDLRQLKCCLPFS